VRRNLIEDVTDLIRQNGLSTAMGSSLSSVSLDDRHYGVPWGYFNWGIYYRKDVFDKLGLKAPKTYDDLLKVSEALKANGITPFTTGTRALWPAAAWFDYLNLRANGLQFHLDLMDGKASYLDPRLNAVFDRWEHLVRQGYFIADHASYSFQEALPFLFQEKAAMYLIGSFALSAIPAEMKEKLDFFPFPTINANVPLFENSSSSVAMIPKGAKNKDDARRFLLFLARPDNLDIYNKAKNYLSTHKDSAPPTDRFLIAGQKLLSSAKGLAQYYDRDTDPDMARIGMQGFQEFMVKPERRKEILERLEQARLRIFRDPS
jgi:multiple sugar transport system substrate-binding protein